MKKKVTAAIRNQEYIQDPLVGSLMLTIELGEIWNNYVNFIHFSQNSEYIYFKLINDIGDRGGMSDIFVLVGVAVVGQIRCPRLKQKQNKVYGYKGGGGTDAANGES